MKSRILLTAFVILAICQWTVAQEQNLSTGSLAGTGAIPTIHGGTCGPKCCVDCGVDYGPLWANYCEEKQMMHARLASAYCQLQCLGQGVKCRTCKPRCSTTSCCKKTNCCATPDCCGSTSEPGTAVRYHLGDPPEAAKAPDPALPPEPKKFEIQAPHGQSARRPAKRIGALRRLRSL